MAMGTKKNVVFHSKQTLKINIINDLGKIRTNKRVNVLHELCVDENQIKA